MLEKQNKNGISNIYLISSKEQLTPHHNKSELHYQTERSNLGQRLHHCGIWDHHTLFLE